MKKYRTEANMQVLFVCPKCGRQLAWAVPSAEMQCPACGIWVTGKNRKGRGRDVYLPPDSDQTVLF